VRTREASCSCGKLRVSVEGDPVRISVCHCLACQQRTGSAFGFQARYPRGNVVISGESREWTRVSDHGESRTFSFCPECGATVYYVCGPQPELVAVTVGSFADPSFPEPWFSVWEGRRHAWVAVPDGVQHDG
jgi:hypothetical protein